jgi:hypothetical protein
LVRDRFGRVLVLLVATVFFSISAPHEPWVWLATGVVLAVALGIAMLVSGARPKVVGAWLCVGGLGIGASIVIAVAQAGDARAYLSLTILLLTLLTMGAIAYRL